MAIYFLWYGGNSYGTPRMPEDLEMVETRQQAEDVFTDRYEMNGAYGLRTFYTDQENGILSFPAVDSECSMDVYTFDPRTTPAPYPSFRVTYSRGQVARGVVWDPC